MLNKATVLLSLLILAGWAVSASAGNITQYSDRASFDAAVGSTTIEDFLPQPHFPITSGILNNLTNEAGIVPGDIKPGVTYSTPVGTGFFFNIDGGAGFVGGFLDGLYHNQPLTITFDSPVAAFGFDTNLLMGTQMSYVINFTSDSPNAGINAVVGTSNMQFFGFQSDAADIESVVITGNHETFSFALDNFTFGGGALAPATPVPAMSAWALILFTALLGLAVFSNRRRIF